MKSPDVLPAASNAQFGSACLALFKNSADAILLADGARLHANTAACELLGYADDEIGRLALADLFDLGDAKVAGFFQRLGDSGHASGDFTVRRKERPALLVNADGTVFTSPAGAGYQTLMIRKAGVGSSLASQRQHSEIGLRAVIETLPHMFWLKDTAGAYLLCNELFERYVGCKEADLIGKTDYDITDPQTADARRLHDAAAVLAGGETVIEQWVTFKSGRRMLMAITKAPMRTDDGKVIGVLGISRDITELKRHENLQEANNSALAHIARGAPVRETLEHVVRNIEEQNPEMLCSVMLLSADGRHLQIGAAPSLPAAFCAGIDGAMIGAGAGSCGSAAFSGESVFVDSIATDPLWADFRTLALENGLRACWSTPIRSAGGILLGTFAIYYREPRAASDGDLKLISMATSIASIAIESANAEKKRIDVAEELRDHQTRLALALEGSETGVWDRDLRTSVVNYSPRWKALFGFTENDQPTRNDDSVGRLHPDDLAHVKRQFQAHLQGRADIYAAEHRVRCRDGSYKWVISRGKIVDRDAQGVPLRIIGTTTDIHEMKALAEKLRQGRDLITNLTNEVPGLVYQHQLLPDGRSTIPYASEGIRTIYEVTPEEVAGDAAIIFTLIHPDDRRAFIASLKASAEQLVPWHLEYRVILPQQGLGWRLADAQPRKLADGSILWHGFITDISERKKLEKTILESEEKYRTLIENSPDAITRYDLELRRIYVNKEYERISGIPMNALLGRAPTEVSVLEKQHVGTLVETLREVIQRGAEADVEVNFERDGQHNFFHTRAIPEFDEQGYIKGVLTFSRDITERKRMEAELQQLATTDFLTGLPNRRYFVSRMEEELARIQRLGVPRTTVLMIDIDHFKNINDTYGHATGDLVLKNFAEIARNALRKIDTVGRVGGEEFAIILPGADVKDAEVFAERFRKKVEGSSVMGENNAISVTISIGISAINPADANADAILHRTDKALYRAKQAGRNRVEVATWE